MSDHHQAVSLLREICDMQAENYGNGIDTHIDLIALCKRARDVIAAIQPAGDAVAYAMVRGGAVQGVERYKAQADSWVNAEAVPLYFAQPAAPVQAAPVGASLWPCGDCGKSVKEACSNRPCGYRAMQQKANEAAYAPEVGASVPAPVLSLGVALRAPDVKALNDYTSALINWARATHTPEVKASELPPLPAEELLCEPDVYGHTEDQLRAYGQACYRVGVQRGAEVSAATYSPMLKAASRKASELPSIADDAEFQSCVDDIYTADGARQRREATKKLAAYIAARSPVAALSASEIDDMAFGYCPSGKIGELREFAAALISRSPVAAPQPDTKEGGV